MAQQSLCWVCIQKNHLQHFLNFLLFSEEIPQTRHRNNRSSVCEQTRKLHYVNSTHVCTHMGWSISLIKRYPVISHHMNQTRGHCAEPDTKKRKILQDLAYTTMGVKSQLHRNRKESSGYSERGENGKRKASETKWQT